MTWSDEVRPGTVESRKVVTWEATLPNHQEMGGQPRARVLIPLGSAMPAQCRGDKATTLVEGILQIPP